MRYERLVSTASTDKIHVLCVDDDTAVLELTKTWLSRTGDFSVRTETDPRDALAVLRDETSAVDAVISDYQMPDMNGLAFLAQVRERHPTLPFVLFTGAGSESIASRAITAGVTDYLRKHGRDQYDLLANRVRNAVESDRMKRDVERERRIREWILEATPVGVVGHDRTGDVLFLNDRATEILAAPVTELDGRAYSDAGWTLLTENGDPVTEDALPYRRVVDSRARLEGERYRLQTSDGTEREIVVHGSPLWDDADEAVEGAVIAFYAVET